MRSLLWIGVFGVLLPGVAGAAPPSSSSSSSPPRVTAEIPDLTASAGPLSDLLRWAALAEPELGPERIGARFQTLVGVDPLSLASLRAAGVDPSKPVRITVDDVRRQLVVEVSLLDPVKARAHADGMRAKTRGAAPVLGGAGFVVGIEPSESLALVVREKDAVLVLGEGYKPGRVRTASVATPVDPAQDRRLDYALGKRKRGTPSRPSKALLEGERVDVWAVVEPEDGVERVDVVLRAGPGELRVEGEAVLEMGPEVVLGEGLRGGSASVRLVEAGPLAADARTTLSRAGLREILSRLGVPEALASSLAGPVHGGVTADGTLFAAAALAPKADPAPLSKALATALRGKGVEVAVVGGALTARIGDSVLAPAVAPGAGAPARGALAADIVPAAVLSAVERQRTLLGIKPMQLMMVRVLMARLVAATQSITVDASMPSNRIKGSVRMKYTLPAR